jgi:hypothetical protein
MKLAGSELAAARGRCVVRAPLRWATRRNRVALPAWRGPTDHHHDGRVGEGSLHGRRNVAIEQGRIYRHGTANISPPEGQLSTSGDVTQ